ncbi:MerR family transcriptional regulator [Virgibacillus oceani]
MKSKVHNKLKKCKLESVSYFLSTLSNNLLQTVRNEETNYRMYSEDQVPIVKLIASLRTATIPIRDIQLYLKSR